MYLSIHGKPTDTDLERYPAVHLTEPMNGIIQSWTIPTHLVMGSLLGPMTLMRDFPLILTLMSLGIMPKGQYKLSVFWMTCSTNHITQQLQASLLPNNHSATTTPSEGNYRAKSQLVTERLCMVAQDMIQWDKITFFDRKFLLHLLIQDLLKEQFSNANPTATTQQFEDNNSNPGPFLTFEDELFFVHGIHHPF